MVITEQWMQRVVEYIKLPPEQVMMMVLCMLYSNSFFLLTTGVCMYVCVQVVTLRILH